MTQRSNPQKANTSARRGAPEKSPDRPKGAPRARSSRPGRGRGAARAASPASGAALDALTEEERIESAKYLPRELPRVFEEERFLFPESYGVSRVRLMVKDPDWLFAHWDVDAAAVDSLKVSLGQRAAALASLTLRVADPTNGGASVILLPPGARSWYVRTDSTSRSYRAELGLTLPSGEFRRLAVSNTVTTPRVGPSADRAARVVRYGSAPEIPEPARTSAASAADPAGPWRAPEQPGGPQATELPPGVSSADVARGRGGASDTYRR